MRYVLLVLLALAGRTAVTEHVDEAVLAAYADSTRVPRVVMWAIAWQESQNGQYGNAYVGPGVIRVTIIRTVTITAERTDTSSHSTTERLCQERGRMQINPCSWQSRIPRCTFQRIQDHHSDNVYCAGRHLRGLFEQHGSWAVAIQRWNGSGPMARAYQQRALAYISRIAPAAAP